MVDWSSFLLDPVGNKTMLNSGQRSTTTPYDGPARPASMPPTRAKDLAPDLTCAEAARQALQVPLDAIETLLPLAAARPQEDIEYVHQLRVATRRAGAAMAVFKACLDPTAGRRARKALRRIRRAAAAARDCDVHAELFDTMLADADKDVRPALERLAETTRMARHEAQPDIIAAASRFEPDILAHIHTRLIETIDKPRKKDVPGKGRPKSLANLANRVIPPAAKAVRQEAGPPPWNAHRLHQVRIRTKRLRYICEIFQTCTSRDQHRSIKKQLIPLLDVLGEMNDTFNVMDRIESVRATIGDRDPCADSMATLFVRYERTYDNEVDAAARKLKAVMNTDLFELLESGRYG